MSIFCEKPCPQHKLDGCSQVKSHATVEHGSPTHVHRLPNETSHLFDDTGRVWGWKDEKHGWPLTASQFQEMLDPSFDPNEPDFDAYYEEQQDAAQVARHERESEGPSPSLGPDDADPSDEERELQKEAKEMFPDLHPSDGAALMRAMYETGHRDAGDR